MNTSTKSRLELLELRRKYEDLLNDRTMDSTTKRGIELLAADPEGEALIARLHARMYELLGEAEHLDP